MVHHYFIGHYLKISLKMNLTKWKLKGVPVQTRKVRHYHLRKTSRMTMLYFK